MNGLKLACNLYGINFSDIADKMGINRANISMWIKNGSIPEERLPVLEKMFPELMTEYFTKGLTENEIVEVKKAHLKRLAREYGFKIEIRQI
ncbi:hypothetical protein D3C87_624240 [compost metagenome]